jgi:hypothetical protein
MTRLQTLIKEVLSQPKKKDCNCGCNTCGNKSPVLTEGKTKINISEGLTYHMDKKIPLFESVYRIGSNKHFDLINEARTLWVRGLIDVSKDDQAILETHLGNFGMYEGEKVPLDMPMVNEEKELKKGDKLKLKLKNGKEFEVTFDSYSKTDGIGYMKYIDKDGDPVRGTFSLNSIVSEGFYSSPSDMDETGLNVRPKDQIHANMLKDALENSGLYAEWNAREGYFFFPEEQDLYDQLEMEIQDLMDENNIRGYIEGVFEESLEEVTRYSGFNRNPEDPDSEKFEPTGAVSQFQEDLRALFGKFKGDLKNPEFIKGVAEIMVSWKSLLRSQLNEERTFTTNPNIKELKKGMTVRVINSKKHVSGPGTFSSGSVKKIGKIVSIGKNKVTINVPDREKPIIATTVGSVGYMGEDFEIVDDILNEAKKKKKKKKEKKDPPLGKPKRGGSKAYYVYVRDPKTKKIKKVSFGSGGLRAKIKNKQARNAFASRHNCDKKKDRTTAGYWSCNLPRYAEQLGLGSKMNTFW